MVKQGARHRFERHCEGKALMGNDLMSLAVGKDWRRSEALRKRNARWSKGQGMEQRRDVLRRVNDAEVML